MTYRITDAILNARILRLNKLTNSPETYRDEVGVINTGHYTLSHAYGGVCLHRVVNTSGGCADVFSCGHIPKRELFYRICAFLDGIETVKGV